MPNGQIASVINLTCGFSFPIIDGGVANRETLADCMKLMLKIADGMRAEMAYSTSILEDMEMARVNEWGDSAVVMKANCEVAPARKWSVEREYWRRSKIAFDAYGIEAPFPHLTVYAGVCRSRQKGEAPALLPTSQRVAAACSCSGSRSGLISLFTSRGWMFNADPAPFSAAPAAR